MSYYIKAQKAALNSLSIDQIAQIESMLNKTKRADIAQKVGISESRLKRAASLSGWKFTYLKPKPFGKYSEELTKEVISYFEENGLRKTEDKFPDIKIRSIVERYKRNKPRQVNWTDSQIIQAVKFGPFISLTDQAKFFNRPYAYEGSIRSLWSKRLRSSRKQIHGFPFYKAKMYVKETCPSINTAMNNNQVVYLWSEMKKHFKDDCPEFIKISVEAMSLFQIKLFGDNPQREVLDMINSYSCISTERKVEK